MAANLEMLSSVALVGPNEQPEEWRINSVLPNGVLRLQLVDARPVDPPTLQSIGTQTDDAVTPRVHDIDRRLAILENRTALSNTITNENWRATNSWVGEMQKWKDEMNAWKAETDPWVWWCANAVRPWINRWESASNSR